MLTSSLSFIFVQQRVYLQDWSQREILSSSFEKFSQEFFYNKLLAASAHPSGL